MVDYNKPYNCWWSAVVDKDGHLVGLISAPCPEELYSRLRKVTHRHHLYGKPFTGKGNR